MIDTTTRPHSPRYLYCPDPETCCETWDPLAVLCAICGQDWPCATKRSHHTQAQIARLERWAQGRPQRPPREAIAARPGRGRGSTP